MLAAPAADMLAMAAVLVVQVAPVIQTLPAVAVVQAAMAEMVAVEADLPVEHLLTEPAEPAVVVLTAVTTVPMVQLKVAVVQVY